MKQFIITSILIFAITSCGGNKNSVDTASPKTFDGTLSNFGDVSSTSGICVSGQRGFYEKQELVYDFEGLCSYKGGTVSTVNLGGNPPDTCTFPNDLVLTCSNVGGNCSHTTHVESCHNSGGFYKDNRFSSYPPVKVCSSTISVEDMCEASGGNYINQTGIFYKIPSDLSQNFKLGTNSVLFKNIHSNDFQYGSYQDVSGVTHVHYYVEGVNHPISLTMNLRVGSHWKLTMERPTSNTFYDYLINNEYLYYFDIHFPFEGNPNIQVDSAFLVFENNP